ncbi:protein PelE [Permianibacter sp. IMCC34836]|uniref:protein PelE n=1 Tax=Permianibacter fluminis TaxID=2738515 RepID=UPI001553D711|nr:protein PelE [Permianibacter fluminis]NQD37311.1 protein PelE [Permianibacter fluminis]
MSRLWWTVALALELASVVAVMLLEPAWLALLGYAVLHAAATPMLARACWHLLPRRYRLPVNRSMQFLQGMLLLMPLVGAIGLLWGLVGALRLPRSRRSLSLRFVGVPELPFQPPQVFPTPPYSSGALRQILRFSDNPLKRLKAVMATRHMPVHESVPIWQIALKDRVDDVRLLAYAMLDGREKLLTERIQEISAELDELPVPRRADAHRQLAGCCWELVYNGLVQGAVREHWLNAARQHAELALAGQRDIALSVLHVRILLAQDALEEAAQALTAAAATGVAASVLAPWHAEIAFRQRRFAEIPALLAEDQRHVEQGSAQAEVRRWWCPVTEPALQEQQP